MEVKTLNYALTIGVTPRDWKVRPLGTIGTWYSGGTPRMSNRAYWSGDIPWVSPKDMKVPRLYDTIDHISTKAVADGARLMPKGAVLMVIRGMILAHSFPVARAERPLAFNQDMKAVVTEHGIDSNFVLHWLIGNAQRLRSLSTESTHGTKRLPPEALFRVPFPQPPKAEQEAIAEALGDADALIESLEQLIAKKRHVKQGAMQELLTGKRRLPGFDGRWSPCKLAEGIALLSGYHVLAQHCNTRGEGVPYLTGPADFPTNRIQHTKYTQRPVALCAPNDILVTVKGSGSGAIVVADAVYCISRQLMAIRVGKWYGRFVYYSLLYHASKINAASTGLIPGLSRSDILEQSILIPPQREEQEAIATVLTDVDADIAALEAKLAKARQVKQGMMQELLTGKTRLVESGEWRVERGEWRGEGDG